VPGTLNATLQITNGAFIIGVQSYFKRATIVYRYQVGKKQKAKSIKNYACGVCCGLVIIMDFTPKKQ